MTAVNFVIHTISALVACLSLIVLSLVAHSVSLKSRVDHAIVSDVNGTGMSFLFWPACGGIVDCSLFLFLWVKTPFNAAEVSTIGMFAYCKS